MKLIPKRKPPVPAQCSETTIKGKQCDFPSWKDGLCRLHAYLRDRKAAA